MLHSGNNQRSVAKAPVLKQPVIPSRDIRGLADGDGTRSAVTPTTDRRGPMSRRDAEASPLLEGIDKMRFFQGKQNGSVASAGFLVTLVAVVWCASCGSTRAERVRSGDDGTQRRRRQRRRGTCTGFGGCTSSSSGGGSSSERRRLVRGQRHRRRRRHPHDGGRARERHATARVLSAANVTSLKAANSNSASHQVALPLRRHRLPGRPRRADPAVEPERNARPASTCTCTRRSTTARAATRARSPPQLTDRRDQQEWATAYAQSGGKSDPLTVELSTITGGTVSGAIKETLDLREGQPRRRRLLQHLRLEDRARAGGDRQRRGHEDRERQGPGVPLHDCGREPVRALRLVPLALFERLDARRPAARLSGPRSAERQGQHVVRSHQDADAGSDDAVSRAR